jgi:hypothetical protein
MITLGANTKSKHKTDLLIWTSLMINEFFIYSTSKILIFKIKIKKYINHKFWKIKGIGNYPFIVHPAA